MTDNYTAPTPTQETQPTPEQILDAGADFLGHFGIQIDPRQDKTEFLDALRQLDPRYQGDRNLVRWQLEGDQTEWSNVDKDVIMRTAEAMGILNPETLLVGNFDMVISLGAARQANLDRAKYAAEAIDNGQATTDMLVVTGSDRKLNEAEQQNTVNYAPDAQTEFDLAVGAAKFIQEDYPEIDTRLVHVEDERANTTAVIEKVLDGLREQGVSLDGMRIGAVTTQIYQPFTSIEVAAAAKKYGISETFVAGNPSDPEIVAKRTTATYLSEILRTLRAAIETL